jgi:hypothetical protein
MKLFDELNDETLVLYAAKNYYNPTCIDAEEFYEDLNRFKYIKRLITKYNESSRMSVNLLLNHVVVIFNVFGIEPGLRMLEYKIDVKHWHIIKPFLVYLKAIDNDKYTGIPMDQTIVEQLREL